MEPHQERVIAEKKELDEKLDKLRMFIDEAPFFKTLSIDEQHRLVHQCNIMKEYSTVLDARINAF